MMGQFMMDLKNEPIQSLLRNMKSSYEYSFHQHQILSAAALAQQQQEQSEGALDLTAKRRFSVESETRKTTSPSSLEESPNARESPIHHHHNPATAQYLLHHHRHMSEFTKMSAVTPEHAIQYQPYNFEQTSPSTTTSAATLHAKIPRLPIFEGIPLVRKLENISPSPAENISKTFSSPSPSHQHHQAFDHYESVNKSRTPPMLEHEDSNDIQPGNLSSSSSSIASSQKSPSSSTISNSSSAMMIVGRDGKLSRPFKAYPKDPLSLAAASSILDQTSAEKYAVFRKRMLDQIHAANGGNPVINNPKMRRITGKNANEETNNNEPLFSTEKTETKIATSVNSNGNQKDEAYFERRKKNNAAAKKSRDRRRIKEDEIAIRAAFLERENIELKFELAAARKQLALYGVTAGISSS
ncbi:hypothetical protein PVAND_010174 [Polypedilum vanderplanki]|uniref:BZIP domain-containing protein n=1 Tax=Polypedilum vanderplanki TaxID=319348 RepID=A0A9J6CFV1_POLVA|nr:hypothetical protein PVAND_010174 [Polypedilum vanderplanki]